jgi:predicted lipoprotein
VTPACGWTSSFRVIVLALGTIASACKPWTVRPIEETAAGTPRAAARFDAPSFVESIWSSKVEPLARASSVDIVALADAPPVAAGERKSLLLKGTARVTEVDLRSRVGLAYLDVRPVGVRRLALQVGPVVRGSALRDALGFIKFGDFVNQIDYAAAATELNARALRSTLGAMDPQSLVDRRVSFAGAAALGDPASTGPIEIVPVTLQVEERSR